MRRRRRRPGENETRLLLLRAAPPRVAPAAVVDDDDDSEPDFDAVLRAAEKDERGDECIDADDFDEVSDNDSEGEAAAALLEQLRKYCAVLAFQRRNNFLQRLSDHKNSIWCSERPIQPQQAQEDRQISPSACFRRRMEETNTGS
eukprot:gene24582-biopygen19436